MTTHPFHSPRSITFHLTDDLGNEDWVVECHHEEFEDILRQAILGLEEEMAPRKFRLSRIERDD